MNKNNLDPKLIHIYNEICCQNDNIIKIQNSKNILGCAFLIEQDYSMGIIGMMWRDNHEKNIMRANLLRLLASHKFKAYILVLDAHATIMNNKTGKIEVRDVCMRTLYTRDGNVRELAFHKNGQILEKERLPSEDCEKLRDEWDLWGEKFTGDEEDREETEKWYSDFKRDNPDKFRNNAEDSEEDE